MDLFSNLGNFIEDIGEYLKDFFQRHVVITGVISNITYALLLVSVGYIYNNLRRSFFGIIKARRTIKWFFTKDRYILIWNDDKKLVSESIRDALTEKFRADNLSFNIVIIENPDELLYYPASAKQIAAIILIVSDVTKLSETEKVRQLIQDNLVNFINNGGVVIGTHDIIYKRTRNEKLKKIFGYEWKYFDRCNLPVKVEINRQYKDHPLIRHLPKSFMLDDGEVIWGDPEADLEKDVIVLLSTSGIIDKAGIKVPMLCVRKIPCKDKKGLAIWLSSCDKGNTLAKSLSPPTKEIIQIFYNSISLSEEIKAY